MDSLITAAARALAAGDPLGALNRVALRDDPPALALRGTAMAQLGDLARARELLRRAARAFGAREAWARARCMVAEAEVALASRDLAWPDKVLDEARATLGAHGDRMNVAHVRCLEVRYLLLIGRLNEAERALDGFDPTGLPPAHRAAHELVVAGIALRRLRAEAATAALARAARAARETGIASLQAEVEGTARLLELPAARWKTRQGERLLRVAEIETLLGSDALVIDACRYAVAGSGTTLALARRPVLFALATALGEAWPGDVPRQALITRAFRTRSPDETHRARLRVEIGRLRALLRPLADVRATSRGFALLPHQGRDVVVLAQPVEERHAAALALLADGEAWSSSALALALGISQRSVQRALDTLAAAGKVQGMGRGRGRRWTTPPMPGCATVLLLPAPWPTG